MVTNERINEKTVRDELLSLDAIVEQGRGNLTKGQKVRYSTNDLNSYDSKLEIRAFFDNGAVSMPVGLNFPINSKVSSYQILDYRQVDNIKLKDKRLNTNTEYVIRTYPAVLRVNKV